MHTQAEALKFHHSPHAYKYVILIAMGSPDNAKNHAMHVQCHLEMWSCSFIIRQFR